MSLRLVTPNAIISFPHLFTPTAMEPNAPADKLRYSAELIFPEGTDLSDLKAAATEAAKAKWGDKIPGNMRSPFREGDTDREGKEGYEGTTFITARSKMKPAVVSGPDRDRVDDADDVYAGCVVRASLTAFAYDTAGNKGVSFFLNNVWKLRDGERLGGGPTADDDFGNVQVDADAFGADTDAPF